MYEPKGPIIYTFILDAVMAVILIKFTTAENLTDTALSAATESITN